MVLYIQRHGSSWNSSSGTGQPKEVQGKEWDLRYDGIRQKGTLDVMENNNGRVQWKHTTLGGIPSSPSTYTSHSSSTWMPPRFATPRRPRMGKKNTKTKTKGKTTKGKKKRVGGGTKKKMTRNAKLS
jgi:hypothetical protein